MSKILVSGLINFETTLGVEGFPIYYFPVHYRFNGVASTISGVGYNIVKALVTLGDEAQLFSLVGEDMLGQMVLDTLRMEGIPHDHVLREIDETSQSVIIYDDGGRRQINVDLKDVQDQRYPSEPFAQALADADLAVLCNVNFSRPFLKMAKARGVPIVTDVHTISSLDDVYNRDFMEAADILFMSDDLLPVSPEDWAQRVMARYAPEVLIIGLGADGALLAVREDDYVERCPTVYTRKIVNTIGAGDALLAAFVHFYARTSDPYSSLRRAMVFASYKIGERGAAEGFLTEAELDAWYEEIRSNGGFPPG
ncbi:MAG: carbohydrate kinase family protein [Anaerolineae bacterium]